MQKCKECYSKFRYKNIMKSIWLKNYVIVCDKCGTKYYAKFSTRLILSLSISLPLIINNLANLIFDDVYTSQYFIILYLIWTIIIICVTPFYARYHTDTNAEHNDGTKALLASKLNKAEAEIIISMLESYEIPYLKKSSEAKGSIEICAEYNSHQIDIYVPPDMLQKAKELTYQ